jgi:predicted metalloprotease with PDZ domain
MKKVIVVLSVLALALMITPVFAGEGHKCEAGTQECLDKMASHLSSKGWVGIELDNNDDGTLVVTNVVKHSPASEAGLQKGDILLAMNGLSFSDESQKAELKKAWGSMKPGNKVAYNIARAGSKTKVKVTLGTMPSEMVAKYVGKHMLDHASVAVAKK